ncbi:hypothetical protein O6H91_11G068100 [Diphasiastrum complanatum]|uniref:Uncharacterized protein n=1 Tax=Diphasiastrum complanatum TaxID=34168 RepID=A0ACC2CAE9_DIPCM|nr:hypothetical protein O6H91_11G068100 [Diphasiastrum complanatum]
MYAQHRVQVHRARERMKAARGLNTLLLLACLLIILIPNVEAVDRTSIHVSGGGDRSLEGQQLQAGTQEKDRSSDQPLSSNSFNQSLSTCTCPISGSVILRATNIGMLQWVLVCILLLCFFAPDANAKLPEAAAINPHGQQKHSIMERDIIKMDSAAATAGVDHVSILPKDG